MMFRVKVSKDNRITLPAVMTKRLGIGSGDYVLLAVRNGTAVLMPEPADYSERLRGLHREIWQDMDPDEYIRRERESWGR